MSRKGKDGSGRKGPLERKANVSLKRAEDQVLQTLLKDHPEWIDKDGNCPQCVVEEYSLAEPHYYPNEDKK
ncbi:MAG: hypothetical protein HKN82_08615 [Akkermansiaceae bacterium]|nr:hypothetical protein [Akkermansiaceae bacterium]NNM28884.1 hypothetical protein [Akkermansiaceae bacterium]